MFRISVDESIPHHFESVPLRPAPRAVGWAVALLGIGGGAVLAAVSRGWRAELVAPLAVVASGLLLIVLVRCRNCEVTLGTRRIDVRAGPLHRLIPTGSVEAASRRTATGWRRLFATEELVLRIDVGSGEAAIPSRRPQELHRALSELTRR